MFELPDMFAPQGEAVVVPAIPVTPVSSTPVSTPASWFAGLSAQKKRQVRHVATGTLILHEDCECVPFLPHGYAAVLANVRENGVLWPLGVSSDGKVLDGRYRLQAAKELGIADLPVLTIDVAGDDAARWMFEIKNGREHLDEAERAVLAFQYQKRLSRQYVADRTTKMNDTRLGKADGVPVVASPKRDSRAESAKRFKVSVRKISIVSKIAEHNPALLEQIMSGEVSAHEALKQLGRQRNADRAEDAKAAFVREEDVQDGVMENRIHHGDAREVLKKIAADTASLVLCSPVYHGARVDYDPPLPPQTYQQWKVEQADVLSEAYRVSRSSGRLVVNVDTTKNPLRDGDEMLPLFADILELARGCGWKFWMDIAWIKPEVCGSKTTYGSFARCSAPGWGRDHEWILVFFKNQKKLEGDEDLCDLGRDEHIDWWRTTWELPCETRRAILDHHCAPFPEQMVERLIKLLTYRRDLVIDPYNGSGTTTAVASRLERRYIGIDRSEKYCAFARHRILSERATQQADSNAA